MRQFITALTCMLALFTATAAQADHFRRRDFQQQFHPSAPMYARHHDCGPRPARAPWGQTFQHGRYELQNVQRWVAGQPQQIWEPGTCWGHGRWRQCRPGGYRTEWTQGHYEYQQEWVWVSFNAPQARFSLSLY